MKRVLLLATICGTRFAAAEPAAAQAEVLFRHGKDLLASGQIAEACAAFEASQQLASATTTLLNLASCREKNGQLATAWGLFVEAERATREASDDLGKQLYETARVHAAKLEPRLSTLTIVVSNAGKVGGLEILRDADVVEPGAWNAALPIDGGTYKIAARAPGNAEWSTTVTIDAERDAKTIEIPTLKAAELGKAPEATPAVSDHTGPVAATEPPAQEDDAPAEPVASGGRHWVPFAVGGAGVALLGGALAAELVGESTYSDAKAELDAGKQVSLWHSAEHDRYAAEALATAGAVSAGVAVWLYIRDRRAERSIAVTPIAGGSRAGIQLVGGF